MSLADLRSADQIEPVPVPWLWPDWLPAGKLVVLDGAPEVGKSTLTSDLAAKLSRGHFGGPPAATLFVTVEEAAGDSIVPRLVAAGADLAKVHVWRAGDEFTLPGRIDLLREAIRRTGAKLVVLDPLSDFLGVAMTDEQSVRRALRALAGLAEETGCTTLLIRHLRKHEVGAAIYRGLGSIGILAAARVVWLLGHHPRGEGRRVLTVVKSNLGERPPAKVFRLADRRVEWVAEEGWLAPEDVRAVGEPSQVAWLRDQLARGPKKMKRLLAEAQVLGMSMRTLQRAKQAVQVVSKRYFGAWYWCLPGQDPRQRFSGLEPVEDTELQKATPGLDPVPEEEQVEPLADGPRLGAVREDVGEREILRRARKAARAAMAAGGKPQTSPPRPASPERGGGSTAAGVTMAEAATGRARAALSPSPPASGGEGLGVRGVAAGAHENQPSDPARETPLPAPGTPAGGDGSEAKPPGSRRFDPAPAGTLDVVIRIGDADADWGAAVADRLADFDELVKFHLGESAGLDWEPAWTGFVGAGRLRLVLAPRQIPPDRLPALEAWARESLAPCESARLAA